MRAERAEVSRGVIEYAGADLAGIDPNQRVRQGTCGVEGRHVFGQLSVEDNLRSGGFVRRLSRKAMAQDLERIYTWFPRLKTKRHTRAGLTSGGEQQMVAIGRALMTRPTLRTARRAVHGFGAYDRAGDLRDHSRLNREQQVSFLDRRAEH